MGNKRKKLLGSFILPHIYELIHLKKLHIECVKLLESNPTWEAGKAVLWLLPVVRLGEARYKKPR